MTYVSIYTLLLLFDNPIFMKDFQNKIHLEITSAVLIMNF